MRVFHTALTIMALGLTLPGLAAATTPKPTKWRGGADRTSRRLAAYKITKSLSAVDRVMALEQKHKDHIISLFKPGLSSSCYVIVAGTSAQRRAVDGRLRQLGFQRDGISAPFAAASAGSKPRSLELYLKPMVFDAVGQLTSKLVGAGAATEATFGKRSFSRTFAVKVSGSESQLAASRFALRHIANKGLVLRAD